MRIEHALAHVFFAAVGRIEFAELFFVLERHFDDVEHVVEAHRLQHARDVGVRRYERGHEAEALLRADRQLRENSERRAVDAAGPAQIDDDRFESGIGQHRIQKRVDRGAQRHADVADELHQVHTVVVRNQNSTVVCQRVHITPLS